MVSFGDLVEAEFCRRENRFRARVTMDGRDFAVHVPNSGRLAELLVPGARCCVSPICPGDSRLTRGTLQLVEHGAGLVCINGGMANAVFADAWSLGILGEPFSSCQALRREVAVGGSRIDFLLIGPGGRLWVEVKCVTLVGDANQGIGDGVARFPDAPTERGRRHLRELASLRNSGDRASVVFMVQRGDAAAFAPHAAMDPLFAEALRVAGAAGVDIRPFRCIVSKDGMAIDRKLPVVREV